MLAKTRKVAADLRPRAFEQNRCFGGPRGGCRAHTATAGALRCSTYMDEGGRDRTTGGRVGTGSGRVVPGPARAPPQSGAYAFEAISAPMIVSTRRGSPDAVPTSSDRACTSSAAVWSAGRRGHPGAKRAGRAIECGFEWNIMVGPRPPGPASSGGARCILDRHGRRAPPGARRRDRRTPQQPRFGPESPRRRSDAEAARSVGETRPPGPPTGSFRPGSSSSRRPCTRGTAADSAAAVTDGQKTLSRSSGNEG